LKLKNEITKISPIKFLVGIEITHLIPEKIPQLAEMAKGEGADIVLVHGETVAEPVAEKTNYYAVISEHVDILAHPGLINDDIAKLASKNNIFFEITTRKGHSITNGHVFKIAKQFNIPLVINNDAHAPGDFVSLDFAKKVVLGAGGSEKDFYEMEANAEKFF
jgi:histidinol phosphatase-like PHP family hydrolase